MTQRVAAYCRVSTDKTDQLNSFESQKCFFSEYITRQPDWLLTGIYADEGITGTSAARRAGFLQLITDALAGKLDLIVTKEVSRFSRNILDTIAYTRKLKAAGVGVLFLNDGISTLDPDSELRLGIMASVAQEESRKTSQRVRWGQQRSMERGVVFGSDLLGYDVENGQLQLEPIGASLVREIFALYVYEKMGARTIAETLTARDIPTKAGNTVWSPATILKILKNEKYCGDLIQRKTVTTDFLTHKKERNRDEAMLICIKDHHEPVVDRSLWDAARAERKRRSSSPSTAGHGTRYPLSGKIICSRCKTVFTCRTRKRNARENYRTWCGMCTCRQQRIHLREELISEGICQIVETIMSAANNTYLENLFGRLSPGCYSDQDSQQQGIIERKKHRLLDAYLSGDISRDEYISFKKLLNDELTRIQNNITTNDDDQNNAAGDALDIIKQLSSGSRAEAAFYLRLVERIDVVHSGEITVIMKSNGGNYTVSFT